MNAEHLTLEELVGEASEARQAHLESCPACASDARAWRAVASGARLLTERSELPPGVLDHVLAAIDARPRSRAGQRAWWPLRPPRPRTWLALGGALAIACLGLGYGMTAALHQGAAPTPGRSSYVGYSAVAGCTNLDHVAGRLTSTSGTSLVIAPASGPAVTVTTDSSTKVIRQVAATVGDITNGSRVFVGGTPTDDGIAAKDIALFPDWATLPSPPSAPTRLGQLALRVGVASGTVADAGTGGFTVVTRDGTRVHVSTSSSTRVITMVRAQVSQLQAGVLTTAVGVPGPNGTLKAHTVEQITVEPKVTRPSPPAGLPALPGGLSSPGVGIRVGCAPDAIAAADLTSAS